SGPRMKRPESTTSSIACFISGVTVARERGINEGLDRGGCTGRETQDGKTSGLLVSRWLFSVSRSTGDAAQRDGIDLRRTAASDSETRAARREWKRHRSVALGRLVDRGDDLERLAPLPAVDRGRTSVPNRSNRLVEELVMSEAVHVGRIGPVLFENTF